MSTTVEPDSPAAAPTPPTAAEDTVPDAEATTTVPGRYDQWVAGEGANPARTKHWDSMGPQGKPDIGWRIPVEIDGDPVAHDGILYASFADQTVRALDIRTGAEIWSREISFGGRTPTVTGDAVYFVDGKNIVATDKETGTEELLVITPPDEFTTSPQAPLIVDGVAYLTYLRLTDGVWTNTVVAHDLATRMSRWRWAAESSRALLPLMVGADAIVVADGEQLLVLDLVLGFERWKTAWEEERSPNAAMIVDDAVVVRDTRLRVFELADGTLRWSTPDSSLHYASAEGLVFTQSLDVRAYDVRTGAEAWRAPWEGRILSDEIAVGERVVYVKGTRGGELAAFDAVTGEELWALAFGGGFRPRATLLAHNGVLVAVDGDEHLVAFI